MPTLRLPLRSPALLCALAFAIGLPACKEKPQELSTPISTAASAPAVPPLVYEVPGTWTKLGETQTGSKRAGYKVPKAGADTEDAELTVFFFGTGSLGDPDRVYHEWFDQFDGDAAKTAVKKTLEGPAGKIEVFDVMGTYKVPLGPAMGPKKKSPMQMVKEKWRLHAAVVRTKDRGNWFFKLVGPDETVQASRDALEAALLAAK